MGGLTDGMTRLCGEINAQRAERGALIQELARGAAERKGAVAGMQAGFRDSHAQMAANARADRAAFVSNLEGDVAAMQAGFRQAQDEMARATKADRVAFVSTLETNVAAMQAGFRKAHAKMAKAGRADRAAFLSAERRAVRRLRKEFATDLAGARAAWRGKGA